MCVIIPVCSQTNCEQIQSILKGCFPEYLVTVSPVMQANHRTFCAFPELLSLLFDFPVHSSNFKSLKFSIDNNSIPQIDGLHALLIVREIFKHNILVRLSFFSSLQL